MISIKNISKTFISNLFSKADNVHKLKIGNPLENKVLINAFFDKCFTIFRAFPVQDSTKNVLPEN